MDLMDSPAYREDLARVAGLDIDWDLFQDTTVVLSGISA